MRPFCGYNMADYFAHWLSFSKKTDESKLPKIFHVNWFRRSKIGQKFLWPGFGENIRAIEWMFNRCDAEAMDHAVDSPIGYIPAPGAINTKGLDVTEQAMDELMSINPTDFLTDCRFHKDFYRNFHERIPSVLNKRLDVLHDELEILANKELEK